MTNTTRLSAVMSLSGSPSTAIKSASHPGATSSIRSRKPADPAASDVMEMIAAGQHQTAPRYCWSASNMATTFSGGTSGRML